MGSGLALTLGMALVALRLLGRGLEFDAGVGLNHRDTETQLRHG